VGEQQETPAPVYECDHHDIIAELLDAYEELIADGEIDP